MRARIHAAVKAALPVALLPFMSVSHAADADHQTQTVTDSSDANGVGASNNLEQVVVTGARAADRTVANSASPIDIISGNEIQQSGASNLVDALNRLVPSLNLPAENNPDLGSMIRGAQLRGLDPSYTLVLINGKRRHSTAYVSSGFPGSVAVDLSVMPIAAIDHIEVLRDGASAVYGSDAIAGVVNIILKGRDTGGDESGQWGKTYHGDGEEYSLKANEGLQIGDKGFISLTGEDDRQDTAVRNFALQPGYLTYPAVAPSGALVGKLGTNNSLPAGDTANPAEAYRTNSPWVNTGEPATDSTGLVLNAGLPINDAIDIYSFGTFTHRVAFAAENFRTPDAIYNSDKSGLSIYPNGFTPFENINEKDFQINAGVRGVLATWNYDLSTGFGKDDQSVYTRHTLNYSLTYPGAPTDSYDGDQLYSDWTSNLDLSRGVSVGFLPQPVTFAFGLEARREQDVVTPGDPLSYYGSGASSLIGNLPQNDVNAIRTSQSVYGELSTNITPRWFIDFAGRGEHYSDFGSTGEGKFATRFDVNDRFGLRATLSNGFHAPGLATESYTYKLDMNGTTSYTLIPSSASAQALGATPLQPERSVNYSAGITFEPLQNVHAALDAYLINIDNRLGSSPTVGFNPTTGENSNGTVLTAAQIAYIEGILANAGIPATGAVNAGYYTSIGDTRTEGLDFTLESGEHWGPGQFNWNLAANYNHNEMTRIASVPTALQGLPGITTLTQATEYTLLYEAPSDKEILNLSYAIEQWSFYGRENRYGQIKRLNTLTATNYFEAPIFTTDVGIRYFFTKQFSLTVAADNALNKYPDHVPLSAQSASTRAQYVNAWDASTPVGLLGGQYYIKLEYHH